MQDNKNIANIDEQFTNLAWEKMQGLLNEEMPVAPLRKRRWGWLWLLLFLGIMAGGTYYNFALKNTTQPNEISNTAIANEIENTNNNSQFEKNNKAPQHSIENKTEKITNTSKSTIISDIQPKEKTINSPKIISKEITKENIIQNNLHIKKENNFTPENNTKKPLFIPQNKVEHNNSKRTSNSLEVPIASNYFNENISTQQLVNSSTQQLNNSSTQQLNNSSTQQLNNSSTQQLISTERIATLSPQILTPKDLNNNELSAFDPIPKPRKFSQTYSVFAGLRSDEFTGFGGVNVGMLAHYRFTPKAGFETGLAYTNLRKNISTNVDYTSEINAEYPDNTKQFNRTISDALSLHYLRLPLSFTYRLHSKIQLATGLNIGYRFAINEVFNNSNEDIMAAANDTNYQFFDDTYSSSFPVYTESIGVDTSMDINERINVPYSFSVRKWDLAAHAGLRYYPIPRLGIDLSYQYGLLNMTKNNTPNRNSGLQLALVWQFHR